MDSQSMQVDENNPEGNHAALQQVEYQSGTAHDLHHQAESAQHDRDASNNDEIRSVAQDSSVDLTETAFQSEGYFYQDDDDADSALGDDRASSTRSLSESIFNYEYENGRRYHAFRAGAYPLPNDEPEQDRMDMQHHIYLLMFGGELYRAPIAHNIQRALDVGCGTGLWAVDFADTHPDTRVTATDLSSIQPTWVPPNLHFEIDDAESEWEFSEPFDYIHIRSMAGSIGDWPQLLQRASNHLAPGGWIELTEFETWASTDDNSLPSDSAYHEFQVRLCEAAAVFGKEMNIAPHIHDLVRNAGFADAKEEVWKCPLSPWPQDPRLKELARYMNLQMMESIEPYSLALFSRVLKWDNHRIQTLLGNVRRDLRNLNYHMYSKVHCVYAQKPYE
ncbi:S-adenosyl-L-methionine-dependent methyltransferase [Talaromyces proteolyticus]|uniref:S-adenosyl-L-methionine-dependent methyltransferase n=1 Tax=Talaromyces proteolyticus TaxID=1131652 RepID=A0AAD4PZY1_9EURO|nr:S-adenosyl-L-methionine-dependent methyltransferase [Talaromyces proteolyticus]KAH8697082.1 S-adenosyl-L-methionine-dependent methyltransferase [Talaromyces proteolyticus]